MRVLIILCLLIASFGASAQSRSRIICGNELIPDMMEQRVPGYKAAVISAFEHAKQRSGQRSSAVAYTIPVIFHVVYNAAAENLDDSIIMSQLQVLNEDYGRLNADAVNTVSYFDSVAADTHIQFTLHSIQRIATSNTFDMDIFTGALPDSLIKFSAAGGDDAVDPDHYLNIWIVNIQASLFGQILGYSYPPTGMLNWPANTAASQQAYDGVVLDYRTIGRNNPNVLIFDTVPVVVNGRTATHEVGHYLGLRHIWGDGTGFIGTNNCQQSDGIDDTPFANAQSPFDCNTTKNTCPGVETYYGADAPDMSQNYMDYSAETCMNLFTRGQAALMQGTLEVNRPQLATKSYPAGIAEKNDQSPVLYPNPSTGMVFMPYSESVNPYTIQVSSVLGENIAISQYAASGSVRLDMSALPMGIYTLDIARDGQHFSKRIVLTR